MSPPPDRAIQVEFSDYDQASFDPDYDTLPLDFFAPMVRRLLSRAPRWAEGDEHRMTTSEVRGLLGNRTRGDDSPPDLQ